MPIQGPEFACALVGSLRSGLLAIDATGVVRAVNAEAQRILGVAADAPVPWLGRDCREALCAQPAVPRLLLAALDGHERPSRAELELAPGPGEPPRTIGFTLGALRDDAGRIAGAALFFRDLTPFEHMDEQQRLRERLAALGQMAAGLAHEIRNPLAGMEVLAGLLRRRLVAHGEQEAELALLGELVGELRSLAATVTASLEFVRPIEIVRVPTEAAALFEQALAIARARLPFSGTIERHYAVPLPPALVDCDQLRSALVNILVNAFEAMSDRAASRLRLSARVERPEDLVGAATWAVRADASDPVLPQPAAATTWVLAVEDDGPGVPPALRERIFYPFFTTRERGSGVGLATAQKIVASHGGSLSLESPPDGGARFVLRLPLASASAGASLGGSAPSGASARARDGVCAA